MGNVNKRLTELERAITPRGKGSLVVYQDPKDPAVFWGNWPFKKNKGRQYSQGDLDKYDTVLKIEFVRNWRDYEPN